LLTFNPAYLAAYVAFFASVLAIAISAAAFLRRKNVSLSPKRLLSLTKDEAGRLGTNDPIYLMHLSIAIGVGVSILELALNPIESSFPILLYVFLAISVPLLAGLIAAFGWRIRRFIASKQVERQLIPSYRRFTESSNVLQLVLILAILLTTTDLVLAFFTALFVIDAIVSVIRNLFVVFYYVKPSINLLQSFDRPLPSMTLPFKLNDILEGKTDPSEVKIGVGQLSEFSSFERLSYDSCVEIGACESACPATAAGRPLSPRILVREIALLAKEKGDAANPFESVREDELWSCVTCGACVHSCPVAVKHLDVIYDLRRTLVNTGKIDKAKSSLLQNLASNQNPYGYSSSTRSEWAKDLDVPDLFSSSDGDYLYWVGCVCSYDPRAQNVAKSLVKIMKKAGVSFAILGAQESCTGDPARRLGEESRFQELAYQNIEKMNSARVKKIVTSCPHCFNTLANEYPLLGGKYEVIHHSQLISNLLREGRINISGAAKKNGVSITLHDACYAARYNSITDEPRHVLAASGIEMKEMHNRKEKTFCCGAGGSNYWFKVPQQRSISSIRTEEAIKTGASSIATECPFCLSMFEDSTRVRGSPMAVRDIAEIVAERL
jgi:Fe-S oxidoreductase